VTLTTGARWTLREDYCGQVDHGDQWSAKGTFTFTTADGATLSGTFTSRATLPTDGEPYRMTITGGTGGFTGAAGTCDVDNHVQDHGDGTTDQWGTFTCDLSSSTGSGRSTVTMGGPATA
jgi:hypothetical protein